MEMSILMDMSVEKFDNKKYYKVKVNNSKYMFFKSRDHFKKIEKLKSMVFDLVRFALCGEDKKHSDYFISYKN